MKRLILKFSIASLLLAQWISGFGMAYADTSLSPSPWDVVSKNTVFDHNTSQQTAEQAEKNAQANLKQMDENAIQDAEAAKQAQGSNDSANPSNNPSNNSSNNPMTPSTSANNKDGKTLPDPSQDANTWNQADWVTKFLAGLVYGINNVLYQFAPSPSELLKNNLPIEGNTKWLGVFDDNQHQSINKVSHFVYQLSWVFVAAVLMIHGIRRTSIGSFNPNVRFSEMLFFQDLGIGVFFLIFGETIMNWVLNFAGNLAITFVNLGNMSAPIVGTDIVNPFVRELMQLALLLIMVILNLIYQFRMIILGIFMSFWPVIGFAQMYDKFKGIVSFWWKEFGVIAALPVVHGLILAIFGVFAGNAATGVQPSGQINTALNQNLKDLMFFLYGLGAATILAGVIWSSIRLAMSQGNAEKRQKAWYGYLSAVVGSFFVFGAFKIQGILENLLPGGAALMGTAKISDFDTILHSVLLTLYGIGSATILASIMFSGMRLAMSGGRPELRSQAWLGMIGVAVGGITLFGAGVIQGILTNFVLNGS